MKKTKILVIRIRRVGDAILSETICKSLKKSIPNAEVHYLVYDFIGDLFEADPNIDKIIRINRRESHELRKYIKFAWQTVHQEKYDIIIDLRSTISTLLFSAFSRKTKYRIGVKKWYNRFILNKRVKPNTEENYVTNKLGLLDPLAKEFEIKKDPNFEIFIKDEEVLAYRKVMEKQGVNFKYPVMVAAISTRIAMKRWPIEYMTEVLENVKTSFPNTQVILYTARKEDEAMALDMFNKLDKPTQFYTGIQPNDLRELGAMMANTDFLFGNEGDARLLAQAQGKPSLAYFAPGSIYKQWLPITADANQALSHENIYTPQEVRKLAYRDLIYAVTPEMAWKKLELGLNKIIRNT